MIEQLDSIVSILNDYMYSYILIILLLGMGLFYSIKTKFIQFDLSNIKLSFKESLSDSEDTCEKKISPFEAFAVTTASRVGTGNIVGVALAIVIGGPGAVFWMWMTALLGGALAFVESTLGQVYKSRNVANQAPLFLGGAAYYIQKGLGLNTLGKIFAALLIFVLGFSFNALQSNTISQALILYDVDVIYSAIALGLISSAFVFIGLPGIARAASLIVPVMAIIYLILCFVVIISNIARLPEVFTLIFQSAFGLKEFGTGTLMGTIVTGIRRGLFSNEAGMGSAPSAAASASTSHPVKQGLIQAGGVFFDTIILCSATAFLVMFSFGEGYLTSDLSGISLIQSALGAYFGDMGTLFLTICIFLVSFSSILGYYFYSQTCMSFLTSNKVYMLIFQIAIIVAIFVGAIAPLSFVWNLADLMMGVMTLINLYAIIKLYKVIIAVLADYRKQRAEGVDPTFKDSDYECW